MDKLFNEKHLARLIQASRYFVYFMGKLIECHLVKTVYTKAGVDENGASLYTVETTFESCGGHFSVLGFSQVYDSIEDFEANKPTQSIQPISFLAAEDTGEKLCFKLLGYDFLTMKYWIVDNKQESDPFIARELPMDKFCYDYEKSEWENEALPKTDYYPTRNDALNWNRYKVALADGTSKETIGKNRLLVLDEDQKELVNELVSIMSKLKESGVEIQTCLNDNIYAINTRNIDSLEITYDNMSEEGFEACDGWDNRFKIGTIAEWCDDNIVWIKRKEAE